MLDFKATATIEALKQRAGILKSVRQFFDQRGFFEVETPALSHDIVVDRYLEPIPVSGETLGVASESGKLLWLQTSPEFGMKRVLAGGADAIYQISRCFRAGERGNLHNPEFSMLEWYRVGDNMRAGIELLGSLVETTLDTKPWRSLSYATAFKKYAACDVFANDVTTLRENALLHELDIATLEDSVDLDEWRNLILTHVVEPKLGQVYPEVVYDWPASQSALAIVRDENPAVAERFELYYQGVELANGYHELLDPKELLRRNDVNNELRLSDGKPVLPRHSRLVDAMECELPACSGVALGIDRLVMLAIGARKIDEVIAFPIENA